MDLSQLATGLREDPDGFFRAVDDEDVSYPTDGHAFTHDVVADSFWYRHRTACILAALDRHTPPGEVFDVGGGTGHLVNSMAAAGHPAVVVEPVEQGARLAWERGLRPVVNATTQRAGFRDGVLPAVGLFDVVEHVADDHAFLSHVHDLLVDDGVAYVTVPAHAWLWSVDDVRAGHHRRYTRDSLARTLDGAGFDVAYLTAFFRPLPLPLLLVRAIPSRLGWRSADDLEAAARDHRAGPGVVGTVLDRVLAPEVDAIAAGHTMAMGTSLLAVARRR